MTQDDFITLDVVSFEALALEQSPLLFTPPLIERSSNPSTFEYAWRLLTFLFPFKDPANLPPLPKATLSQHRDILDRYCEEAEHLAESQYLNGDSEVRINIQGGTAESIESSFPSKEITRGFQVAFRQFYSPKERAAFINVHKVIAASAKNQWAGTDQWDQFLLWRKAHAKLLSKTLKVLVGEKLFPNAPDLIPDNDPPFPQQIISAYLYGDLIHYGTQAQDLSALRKTPFDRAWSEFRLADAVFGLAHLYIGFSGAIRAILADDDPERDTPARHSHRPQAHQADLDPTVPRVVGKFPAGGRMRNV